MGLGNSRGACMRILWYSVFVRYTNPEFIPKQPIGKGGGALA